MAEPTAAAAADPKRLLKTAKAKVKSLKAEGDALKKKCRYADACGHYLHASKHIVQHPSPAVQRKLHPWLRACCAVQGSCTPPRERPSAGLESESTRKYQMRASRDAASRPEDATMSAVSAVVE